MTRKTKATKGPCEDNLRDRNTLRVIGKEGQSDAAAIAEFAYDPAVRALSAAKHSSRTR